jgi:predicted DNA-binding protein with PD1-like motif
MKIISRDGPRYILKFGKKERYPDAFVKFLEKNKIGGGFFIGLGAGTDPEVSFYDLNKKKYFKKRFKGDFEILNITGNISKSGKETVIHQHITLGGRDFKAVGGHLVGMSVGGTLEIFLTVTAPLKRSKDEVTGLNLLKGR